jgi:2-aminomuconate deaminase|tara:strand:- start:2667 stop:3314 length:648 start_codon:yes stop_codon:yes gene_type:complete
MSVEDEISDSDDSDDIIDKVISAPSEVIEKLYDELGPSMVSSAGGALGATAGGIAGGPVGVAIGSVVGKKVAGKLTSNNGPFIAESGPSAVGAYPHLYRAGELIFVSGIGPRSPENNEIVGGPVRDSDGKSLDYDIKAQTRSVIENIRLILEEYGSSLEKIVDVYSMLINMDRDFEGYNEVYAEYFSEIMPARTTCAVSALPTPIAVELKVIAKA